MVAAYRYEALDSAGRRVAGLLQADTARHARNQLRAQGLLPSAVDPVEKRARVRVFVFSKRGISALQLSLITRQMATLLESGLTVEQTLAALIDETTDARPREVLASVKAEVMAGVDFAGALGTHHDSFPDYYCGLVRAGEQSGALATVLQHLADYLDARQALQQKTTLALLYPAIVTAVAVLIVAGLLVYVVPQVAQVFQHSRQELPLLTRALIAVSAFVQSAWPYLAAAAVLSAVAARLAWRQASVRKRVHALLLRAPGIGALLRGADTARFAATVAITTGGGVPLLSALEAGARVMTNSVLRDAVQDAIARVSEGATLARALGGTRAFPPLLTHLVASGEATGQLGRMLERAARLENQALERRLTVFVTLLEPALILAMGALVLLIVMAVLMPVVSLNQLVR